MMVSFIDKISQGIYYDASKIEGYSDDELNKIERLYDVRIVGQLRQFMSVMGRSSGGLIGDDPIILYRPTWVIRDYLMLQIWLEDRINEFHCKNLFEGLPTGVNRPFLFSIAGETQYFFVATKCDNPDMVYYYDENSDILRSVKIEFFEFMKETILLQDMARKKRNRKNVICRGDIISF